MLAYKSLLCGILSILIFSPVSSGYTVFSDDPPDSCVIIGDPDLYGIGVRLSYYLSFSAIVLATIFDLRDELSATRRGIIIITTAVLIDSIIGMTKGSFSILEWYIVTLETIGLAIPCFVPQENPFVSKAFSEVLQHPEVVLDAIMKEDAVLFGLFYATMAVTLCSTPWIYFILHNQGYREGCSVTTFFFARFNIHAHGWMIFIKVAAIAGLFLAMSYLIISGWMLFNAFPAGQGDNEPADESKNSPLSDEDWAAKLGTALGTALATIGLGIPSAYFAERVIRDNNIDMGGATLGSGSQLIAFLVGFFNVVAVLSKCIRSSKTIFL